MRNFKKLRRGILTSFILIALTLSFTQIAVFETMSNSFTIADHPDLPTRAHPGMVYDNESDLVVIFGGGNATVPYDSTWTYDYNLDSYTEMDPASRPLGRGETGMTYDSIRDQVILFGGEDNLATPNALNDTWLYNVDTDTWTEVFPVIAPSERREHFMVFDSESDRAITFGGWPEYDNETWAYDPGTNVWTKMSPATAPDGRGAYRMVYESESDRVILFGGYNGGAVGEESNYFADTWAYDFNSDTWEELTTIGSPSARGNPSLVYDSESDRSVLFGGAMSYLSYNDTWLFNYNTLTWQEMNPSLGPSKRSRHGFAYDWESDRVIINGGTYDGFNGWGKITGAEHHGKTWAYDVNTNTWERMDQGFPLTTTTPTSTPPPSVPIPLEWIVIGVGVIGVSVIIAGLYWLKRRK